MHRELSAEDAALQTRLREFFTTKVPQEIRDRYGAGILTADDQRVSQRILNEAGLAVPGWPVEHGGQDWTDIQRHIYLTELAAAHVPPALAFNANMIGPVIAAFGSDEIKRRFLPPTANIDIWWAQGFSEPESGSDLASLRTSAVLDGEEWVVNGQKTWTTLGQYGDWIFTLVRTEPDAPKKQLGISMLLIDLTSPGVQVRPITLIDGQPEVNEVFFDNVRVPADQMVGARGQGWDQAKFLLGNERVGVAPTGWLKDKLALAKSHARQVATAEGTALDEPLIAARFAELEAQIMALEVTVLRVAGSSHDGRPDPASSILKLRGSQLQQDILELTADLAGPAAAVWEVDGPDGIPTWQSHSEPHYLNYRKASIYSGSNEVQRQIISTSILGLKG